MCGLRVRGLDIHGVVRGGGCLFDVDLKSKDGGERGFGIGDFWRCGRERSPAAGVAILWVLRFRSSNGSLVPLSVLGLASVLQPSLGSLDLSLLRVKREDKSRWKGEDINRGDTRDKNEDEKRKGI